MFIDWGNSASVSKVTDSNGNSYSLDVSMTSSANTVAVYSAYIPASESPTATVTWSDPATYPEIELYEFSGIGPVDVTTTMSGTSASVESGSATANAGDLLFGGACVAGMITTGESGWTNSITSTVTA